MADKSDELDKDLTLCYNLRVKGDKCIDSIRQPTSTRKKQAPTTVANRIRLAKAVRDEIREGIFENVQKWTLVCESNRERLEKMGIYQQLCAEKLHLERIEQMQLEANSAGANVAAKNDPPTDSDQGQTPAAVNLTSQPPTSDASAPDANKCINIVAALLASCEEINDVPAVDAASASGKAVCGSSGVPVELQLPQALEINAEEPHNTAQQFAQPNYPELPNSNAGEETLSEFAFDVNDERCSTPVPTPVARDTKYLEKLKSVAPDIELTIPQILRFWVTRYKIHHSKMDALLKMMQHLKENLGLPLTTKKLLEVVEMEQVLRQRVQRRSVLGEKGGKKRRWNGDVITRKKEIGHFLYLGLLDGILNQSIGEFSYKVLGLFLPRLHLHIHFLI